MTVLKKSYLGVSSSGHWGQNSIGVEFWGCNLKILRFIPESLAPNLEKVSYDKLFQSSDFLTLLYFIFYCILVSIVFCCIAAWIQPDISVCQKDFLVVWRCNLWNCSRKYPRMFKTDSFSLFRRQKIEFKPECLAWSCHYATGCFVALLGDISKLKSGWNMKKNVQL